jgi:hypothetical protein
MRNASGFIEEPPSGVGGEDAWLGLGHRQGGRAAAMAETEAQPSIFPTDARGRLLDES